MYLLLRIEKQTCKYYTLIFQRWNSIPFRPRGACCSPCPDHQPAPPSTTTSDSMVIASNQLNEANVIIRMKRKSKNSYFT